MAYFRIGLAGVAIGVRSIYDSTALFCADHLTQEDAQEEIALTQEDIALAREKAAASDIAEGRSVTEYGEPYLEKLALCRRATEVLIRHDVLLFHGAVVAVNGGAYMFTAKSGTGKTTHIRLWMKNIPGVHVLNGDKPLIAFREDGVYACDSPWRGKEKYGRNECLPLRGIAVLERGVENKIEKLTPGQAFSTLVTQSHHPDGNGNFVRAMRLIGRISSVPLWLLTCNMADEAARVSYSAMTGDVYE